MQPLTVGTVCSGIGAPEKATEELGWVPVYSAEIDPFAAAVHAVHWPDCPNLGDMTQIDGAEWPVDVVVGGTPCQAFSFAGGRASLADPRGNLTLTFIGLLHATRSLRYGWWENVPGVLSTSDNAFGCFLGAAVGADGPLSPPGAVWGARPHFDPERYDVHRTYGWKSCRWPREGMAEGPLGRIAWRTPDAQYFDLPQRRERVFAIFCPAGSQGDPAAVLFEPQGLHRNPPSRGKPGQGLTHDLAPSLTASGRGVDRAGDTRGQDPVVAVPLGFGGGNRSGAVDVAATLTAKGNRQDFEVETFVAQPVAYRTTGNDGVYEQGETIGALTTSTDPNAHVVAQPLTTRPYADRGAGDVDNLVAFSSKDYGGDATEDLSPTLRAGGHLDSHANAGNPPAVAFAMRGREEGNVPEVEGDGQTTGALRAASGGSTNPHVAQAVAAEGEIEYAVRRLTPDECARLQGFPDGHSRISWKGRPADECPDGPQYKTYGNSMAVNVIRWIARRIDADARRVDALRKG